MMRILITGISGFVARHFLQYLSTLNDEIQVVGIYNQNLPTFTVTEFKNINLYLYQADLTQDHALDTILQEFSPTHILHLAARSSVADSWIHPDKCILQNSSMFLYLLESIRSAKIQPRILSVGSAEEYGFIYSKNSEKPILESHPLQPISPYGIARQLQYNLVKIYSAHYGLDIVHTRSFNHFGAYQNYKFVIAAFARQITKQIVEGNKIMHITGGDKEIMRDFTDVRDVVRAYYLLLKKAPGGEVYNVCSGHAYKLDTLIHMMADILKVEIHYKTDPIFLRPNENKYLIGDNTKIKKAIGWEPQLKIQDSLTDLLHYWKVKQTT